jgi:hypothetical protein
MMKTILARLPLCLLLIGFLFGCPKYTETQVEKTPQKYEGALVYLESDRICGFFEVQNSKAYEKLVPRLFKMPDRPLCQISFSDNYRMENGPTYLLSSISILVTHEGKSGWYILTMPETHEEPVRRGVEAYGYPKIVRKVTLERSVDRYVGTSYEKDGRTVEFRMTLEIRQASLGPEEKQFCDFIAPFPSLTIKNERVYKFGGSRTPVYYLEKTAPKVWKIKLGEASVEYPNNPRNLLYRLGLGRCITGYWGELKYRYSIAPNK